MQIVWIILYTGTVCAKYASTCCTYYYAVHVMLLVVGMLLLKLFNRSYSLSDKKQGS